MPIEVETAGADPGFFLGGGALVSCSTSTPINHIVFFCRIPVVLENCRSSQGGGGGLRTPCTLLLDPPLDRLIRYGGRHSLVSRNPLFARESKGIHQTGRNHPSVTANVYVHVTTT